MSRDMELSEYLEGLCDGRICLAAFNVLRYPM
jgi:hypothetical protein